MSFHTEDVSGGSAYKDKKIASFKEGLRLEDTSILANFNEFAQKADFQIQTIFPQLVVQQIQNSLAARQLLPKGPDNFELIFHFFGYTDDTPEMRAHRIKQVNLVGPAGLVSMEDTLATELIRFGTAGDGHGLSMAEMGRDAPENEHGASTISENWIRRFWCAYQELMGI
jgi:anthranilate 1,2-dioxygenase large subunit